MIADRIRSRQDVERVLEEKGYQKTTHRTATGTIWVHTGTGEHIQVPDPYEEMYPEVIIKDLLDIVGPKRFMH